MQLTRSLPCCSRAATAEQIHARAMEEYRLRDAEAKAAAAAAADAKALFERAAEAARRAEEARNAEVLPHGISSRSREGQGGWVYALSAMPQSAGVMSSPPSLTPCPPPGRCCREEGPRGT